MAAHRAPALQASAMVADEESSGHTSSESDGYIQEVLQEVEAEEIQRNHAQTTLSDDLSTVAQAGSDASGSNESELEQPLDVLAGMASVPRWGMRTMRCLLTRVLPRRTKTKSQHARPTGVVPEGLLLRGRRGLLLL